MRSRIKQWLWGIKALSNAAWIRMRHRGDNKVMVCVAEMGSGSAADLRALAYVKPWQSDGWQAVVAHPCLSLSWRRLLAEVLNADVVYMQKARHPLNRPHLYPGRQCLVDVDDADMVDPQRRAIEIDVYRSAQAVIAGSHHMAELIRPHCPHTSVIWTSTYLRSTPRAHFAGAGKPVVAWGASDPIGYPMEAEFVRQVVLEVARTHEFEFWVFGADDRKPAIQDMLSQYGAFRPHIKLIPKVAYENFAEQLSHVWVGLNPVCLENSFSQGKSFGKLLAYMVAGTPIISTHCLDYPLAYRHGVDAYLLSNEISEWVACIRHLIESPDELFSLSNNGYALLSQRLTTEKAAHLTAKVMDAVMLRARQNSA